MPSSNAPNTIVSPAVDVEMSSGCSFDRRVRSRLQTLKTIDPAKNPSVVPRKPSLVSIAFSMSSNEMALSSTPDPNAITRPSVRRDSGRHSEIRPPMSSVDWPMRPQANASPMTDHVAGAHHGGECRGAGEPSARRSMLVVVGVIVVAPVPGHRDGVARQPAFGTHVLAHRRDAATFGSTPGVRDAWGATRTRRLGATRTSAADPRPRLMAELGFVTPVEFDELAGDLFYSSFSFEEMGRLDRDVLIWICGPATEVPVGA